MTTCPSRSSACHPVRVLRLWVCFAAVLGLWGCMPASETQILIPIDPFGIPSGLTIASLSNEGVEVRVRGSKSALAAFSELGPKYALDLSGVRRGAQSISIRPEQIPVSEGAEIVSVTPAFITLTIEKEMKKMVPVTVSAHGKPAAGFSVTQAVADPESVMLAGPETVLLPVVSAPTHPVDVTGRTESFKKEVALDLPDNIKMAHPDTMIVGQVLIAEKIAVKTFEHIRVQGRGAAFAVDINPPELSVTVKGPENILNKLHPDGGLDVYVDLEGLRPGVYVRRATLSLPVNIFLMDVKPELFTVKIIGVPRPPENN